MEDKRFEALARGPGSRCNRREMMRCVGAAALAGVGVGALTESARATPAPSRQEPVGDRLPADLIDVSHGTQRVAGLGLAAAAILVAGKLIRDNERDSEL